MTKTCRILDHDIYYLFFSYLCINTCLYVHVYTITTKTNINMLMYIYSSTMIVRLFSLYILLYGSNILDSKPKSQR